MQLIASFVSFFSLLVFTSLIIMSTALYAWVSTPFSGLFESTQGANSHGQLGTGDCLDRHTPTLITSNEIKLISGGGGHSVISDGIFITIR